MAFLFGGLTAVFITLAIGIRKADRARRRRTGSRDAPLDAFTPARWAPAPGPSARVVRDNLEGS